MRVFSSKLAFQQGEGRVSQISFNLLLPDGAVKVYFHPPLNPDNYEKLLALVESVRSSRELNERLSDLSSEWGVDEFRIDTA